MLFAGHCGRARARGRPAAASRHATSTTGEQHRVEFPEPVYSVVREPNPEFDAPTLPLQLPVAGDARLGVRLRPATARAHAAEARRRCSAATTPPTTRRSASYATAPDGDQVPISIVYQQGTRRETGASPLLLVRLRRLRISAVRSPSQLEPAVACSTAASSSPSRTSAAAASMGKQLARRRPHAETRRTRSPTSSPPPSTWSTERYTAPRPPRDRGRQRGRAADGRGGEPAARPVQGRGARKCRSST